MQQGIVFFVQKTPHLSLLTRVLSIFFIRARLLGTGNNNLLENVFRKWGHYRNRKKNCFGYWGFSTSPLMILLQLRS
jgi:hypothetical protein